MDINNIIRYIQNIEELKEIFNGKEVIIFNRLIKSSISDICKLYNANDSLVLTYDIKNIKNNTNFILYIDIWSKKSLEEVDKIYSILIDRMGGNSIDCYFNEDNTSEYIEDELYYRKNIKFNYTLYR